MLFRFAAYGQINSLGIIIPSAIPQPSIYAPWLASPMVSAAAVPASSFS